MMRIGVEPKRGWRCGDMGWVLLRQDCFDPKVHGHIFIYICIYIYLGWTRMTWRCIFIYVQYVHYSVLLHALIRLR